LTNRFAFFVSTLFNQGMKTFESSFSDENGPGYVLELVRCIRRELNSDR